jgi:hypothetical protein
MATVLKKPQISAIYCCCGIGAFLARREAVFHLEGTGNTPLKRLQEGRTDSFAGLLVTNQPAHRPSWDISESFGTHRLDGAILRTASERFVRSTVLKRVRCVPAYLGSRVSAYRERGLFFACYSRPV